MASDNVTHVVPPEVQQRNQSILADIDAELARLPKHANAAQVLYDNERREIRFVWADAPDRLEKLNRLVAEGKQYVGMFTIHRQGRGFRVQTRTMGPLDDMPEMRAKAKQILAAAAQHCGDLEFATDPPSVKVVVVPLNATQN